MSADIQGSGSGMPESAAEIQWHDAGSVIASTCGRWVIRHHAGSWELRHATTYGQMRARSDDPDSLRELAQMLSDEAQP